MSCIQGYVPRFYFGAEIKRVDFQKLWIANNFSFPRLVSKRFFLANMRVMSEKKYPETFKMSGSRYLTDKTEHYSWKVLIRVKMFWLLPNDETNSLDHRAATTKFHLETPRAFTLLNSKLQID